MRFFLCLLFSISLSPYVTLARDAENVLEVRADTANHFVLNCSDFKIKDVVLNLHSVIDREKGDDFELYRIKVDKFSVNGVTLAPIEAEIVKKGKKLFIRYIKSPYLLGKGKIDCEGACSLEFDIDIKSLPLPMVGEIFPAFPSQGILRGRLTFKGSLDNMFAKGDIYVNRGEFLGNKFVVAHLNFQGIMPFLKLHDSDVVTEDGSVHNLEGFIDAKDLATLFVSPEVSFQKVSLGEWRVFSRDQSSNVGIIKDIDDKFSMSFDAYLDEQTDVQKSGAELRYEFGKDKFLKLRLQDKDSVIGFERRKEF